MQLRLIFPIFFILLLFIGCDQNRLDVDVSNLDPNLNVQRWDIPLFDTLQPIEDLNQYLFQSNPQFQEELFTQILRLGEPHDSAAIANLNNFRLDPYIHESFRELNACFDESKMQKIEEDLTSAFQHQLYYFPERNTPEVILYHSGFNYGVYPMDNILGIGLEFYMGSETSSISHLHPEIFPNYQKVKMRPDYLVTDAIKGWVLVTFQDQYNGNNLLDEIMFYGKMMYVAEAFLPSSPDSTLMNYTSKEYVWARDNEYRIWKELAKDEVLFETRSFEIQKWIVDGPFTNAGNIPQDAPARLGIYIGWQMIRDYMNKNTDVTLTSLLEENDYQKILRFYKPEKQ